MKPALSIFLTGTLVISGATLIGCSSEQNPPPAHGGTEGGNGAFGTNPSRPGSYQGENSNTQGVTPTTQPSSAQ